MVKNRQLVPILAVIVAVVPLGVLFSACSDRATNDVDGVPSTVQAYARARCERVRNCECKNVSHPDVRDCEARIIAIYQEIAEFSDVVDSSCFGDVAQVWGELPCDEPDHPDYVDRVCHMVPSTGEVGAPCRFHPFRDHYVRSDSCSAGLSCLDGRCAERQRREEGMSCDTRLDCRGDLTCLAGRCDVFRGEGEPCDSSFDCQKAHGGLVNLHCDASGTCRPPKAVGEPCSTNRECEQPDILCIAGRCGPIGAQICHGASLEALEP